MLKRFLFLSTIMFSVVSRAVFLYPQEKDIVLYLKQIEAGNKSEVIKELPALLKKYPNDPSVMFLKGVLTDDGQKAAEIYSNILQNYPGSRYADASVYRLYTFYFATGNYKKATNYFDILKAEYPNSPYISIAKRNIPPKNSKILTGNSNKSRTNEMAAKQTAAIASAEDYKYTIQAGAFTVLNNADALMKEFKDAGYYSNVEDKLVGGTNFHVVYVGKFVNDDDARNFLTQINSKYNLNGVVVKFDSQN